MSRKNYTVMLGGEDRELLHQLKPLIEDAYQRTGHGVPNISFPWIIRAALTLFLDIHEGRKVVADVARGDIVATREELQQASKASQVLFGRQVLQEHGIEVVAVEEEADGQHVRFVTRPSQDAELRSFDLLLAAPAENRSVAAA